MATRKRTRTLGARRLLPVPAMLLLAACYPGLDARHLERLDYGMDYACVDEMLESDLPGLPVLRFFVADEIGVARDCVVTLHEGARGQPDYTLVAIDGRLQAALGRRHYETWWRRPLDACPWTPARLRAVMLDAVATRVPLDWTRLQPHHAELVNPNKRPSPRMSEAMFGPSHDVILAPFLFVRNLFTGDVDARDAEVAAFLLRVAPRASYDEVRAAIGAPTSEWEAIDDGGSQRMCAYDIGCGYAYSLGFLDDRLLWVEFGR